MMLIRPHDITETPITSSPVGLASAASLPQETIAAGAPSSLSGLEHNLNATRVLIVNERRKVTRLRNELVEAVADADVAPLHDQDRCRNVARSIRGQLEQAELTLNDYLSCEGACLERMGEIVEAHLKAAE